MGVLLVDWLLVIIEFPYPGLTRISHRNDEVIAQGFGFTGDFLGDWNNSVYCRVQKIPCKFKEQARIRHSCEKCGLNTERAACWLIATYPGSEHLPIGLS